MWNQTLWKGRGARAVGCALAYVAAAVLSVAFTREAGAMAVFWPANALLLGLLLRMPPRDYPASLAACMFAAVVVNLGYGDPPAIAVTRAAVNLLGVLCGYHLIARMRPALPLSDLRTLFILLAAGLAAPLVSASAGTIMLGDLLAIPVTDQWWTRWSRDAVGMLLLLPLIASFDPRPIRRLLLPDQWDRPVLVKGAELVLALGLLFGIFGLILLADWYGSPSLFAPVLLWIALRFGIFPTAATAATINAVAVISAARDAWPPLFADFTMAEELLSLQLLVLLVALPPLVVAVVVGERARARRQLDDALESMADAFALYDADGRLVLCNPRYPAFLSRIADLVVPGMRYAELVREGVRRSLYRDAPAEAETWIADQIVAHRVGSTSEMQLADGRWLQAIARPTADGGTVDVRRDITERKLLEEAIAHQAMHDALTRLPNRAMFYRELERALARAEREPCRVAVILVDLDRFKDVNDTFGHAGGDQLLVEVANCLADCVRTEDLVARLGGDEFAVIAVSREAVDGFAALARRIVHRLRERVRLGAIEIEPGASLGMTVFPDDPGSLDELIAHADRALYAAQAGGGRELDAVRPRGGRRQGRQPTPVRRSRRRSGTPRVRARIPADRRHRLAGGGRF
jgi:diguanylate cyclase (GGDEF)-like protein